MITRAGWVFALFMMAALHVSAFAVDREFPQESVIGGPVAGFLKKDHSPYRVKETLVIPDGKALIVEAGVEFYFDEGAGVDVRGGSLAIMGEANNPVIMTSLEKNKYWNGVSVTGLKRAEVQGIHVENATFGFAVESGALEIRDAIVSNAKRAGVYVRNASVAMQWTQIQDCRSIGVWATHSASVDIDASSLSGNRIALVAGEGSSIALLRSHLDVNDVAILDFGENSLRQRNSVIEGNMVGVVSSDLPSEDIKLAMNKNQKDLSDAINDHIDVLGEEPTNPYADGRKFVGKQMDSSHDSVWSISGNVGVEVGYHKVLTKHHHEDEPYVSQEDTVYRHDRYVNYFQVPGFFTNWNANILMKSPSGATYELIADVASDSWDHFKVYQFQASYTDAMQRLILGDFFNNAGELYMAGFNAFGASYDINLFKNSAQDPLFVGSVFVGEENAPKKEGRRNYDVYKDYVDDGEAEAQRMIVGGKVRWNMHRRFNGTLGFISSKDYLEDPFFRDGMSSSTNTSNPLVSSKNFFADGNWLFFPGDIKLNGQVAVGGADTVNVAKIRAVNQVFSDAGLDPSNFALLNELMSNPNRVNSLSVEKLEAMFGENSMMTPSEMRAELKRLLAQASAMAKETKVDEMRPSHADFWGHEHWAVSGAYQWSNSKTFIEGFFRYVGREYYSAGSPDLLQNTRMIGGNLKQKIYEFWNLGFGYTMNVENAAGEGDAYNIFGMGEGTQWGMFSGAESDWLKEHEQDQNRTLYIHDAYLSNTFKLNEKVGLSLKYAFNYRTRSTPQRLYANYSISSGIYKDPWFKASGGRPSLTVIDGLDTMEIDSSRWMQYYELADEDFLATQFTEKLMKHTLELGLSFKFPKNVLNVGGVIVTMSDMSDFEQDELIAPFNFTNETYGILGYYFHGSDYFEQRYPVSLTTALDGARNMFVVTPRYKVYNRNEMSEFEWSVMDNLDIELTKDLLELSLSGSLRQNFLSYEIEDEKYDEMELDIEASSKLRVHHTPSLYSDWTLGALFNYRPDNRADEYKDFYVMAALNYEF